MCYSQSKHDNSLFIKIKNGKITILLVDIDDILLTGDDTIEDLKRCLNSEFRIKHLGSLVYLLGIEIARSKSGICLK